MTAVYLDSYRIEAQFDGVNWTNITGDVVGTIHCVYGITANGPLDRVGDIGILEFELNNSHTNSGNQVGYYSPGGLYCRSGFDIGLKLRLIFVWYGWEIVKWQGQIPADGIAPKTGNYARQTVKVLSRDWMEQAFNHELIAPAFTQNKTLPQIAELILANMAVQPPAVIYGTGEETFATVFDTVRTTTRAMTELAKATLPELGYIFMTRQGLKIEGRYTRIDDHPALTEIPDPSVTYTRTTMAGDTRVTEEGDTRIVDEPLQVTVSLVNKQNDMTVTYGKNFYNRLKLTAYPRRVDPTPTILFNLESVIDIAPSETIIFTGRFRDPETGAAKVSGKDMIPPEITTDYLMNTQADGGGSNISANLTILAEYGTGDVTYTFTNNNASTGYITLLQARGTGIYIYDPVDYIVQDDASVAINGPYQLTMDMKYQDDPLALIVMAPLILDLYKTANVVVDQIFHPANNSHELMNALVFVEPGYRIHEEETVAGIVTDFFVQGVEMFIKPGGKIDYGWFVKDAVFDSYDVMVWDDFDWDEEGEFWGL